MCTFASSFVLRCLIYFGPLEKWESRSKHLRVFVVERLEGAAHVMSKQYLNQVMQKSAYKQDLEKNHSHIHYQHDKIVLQLLTNLPKKDH